MHSVLLVFFAFRSLVFLLLLFLTMNPHYMTSYNLVFYCSIKKKKETVFCNNACACVCVCILCHRYQLCLRCAVPNEHIRPVSVCDERQTSLQWLAVAGQCTRHVCVHMRARELHMQALLRAIFCFPADSGGDALFYTCETESAAREQSLTNS